MATSDSLKPRWLPGIIIVVVAVIAITFVRFQDEWPFQRRNLTSYVLLILTGISLLVWWTFFSRVGNRARLSVTYGAVVLGLIGVATLRIKGMTGDMMPIIGFRWSQRAEIPAASPIQIPAPSLQSNSIPRADFPQFLGPDRNGVLAGPALETNWIAHPPQILWGRKVGPAWSGFAIIGDIALTHEQRGDAEFVAAYEVHTGAPLWEHRDNARYSTTIAGEGPRATPTVVGERVFAFGATGILNCLDLRSGRRIWSCDVIAKFGGKIPQWGSASAPLVLDDLVLVHGGEEAAQSIHAFRTADGAHVWSAGAANPSYAALTFATLADTPQVLAFNHNLITTHDPRTGAELWQRVWGNDNVVCASPVIVSSNRVLFSSGYGVGAELLEIARSGDGKFAANRIWKSIRMKAKFSHLFVRDGFLYGLDDGIFACVDLRDGSQRWKEGRFGHGQGLLVGGLYLLMSESGELVLLKPTSDAPDELARFRVFDSKTWNPIALSGDLLLVRNDTEAACLRLKTLP